MFNQRYYFKFKDWILSSDNVSFLRCDEVGNVYMDGDRLKLFDSGYNINIARYVKKNSLDETFKKIIDEIFIQMQHKNFIDLYKLIVDTTSEEPSND